MDENDTPTGRKGGDEALVLALATGLSVPTAARRAGVSERTAYRRLGDPTFRKKLAKARDDLLSAAVGQLLAVSTKAVNTLVGNLKCKDRAVANRAALGILQHMARGVEIVELSERVKALEDRQQ